jgi:hypothetical protein
LELLPWSFVVNWFVNVADYVAAHTPNAGVRQRASWVTVKETYTQTIQKGLSRSIVDTLGYKKVSLDLPPMDVRREELVLERIVDPALSTWPMVDLHLDMYKLTDLGIMMKKLFK